MSERDDAKPAIADRAAEVTLEGPTPIGRGYMNYERYGVSIDRHGEPPLRQQRDVLRANRVAAMLPIDLEREQVVLIRQFRLPGHLATGRGDMVEIVAGRIEHGEAASVAARRECAEETGVAPERLVELFSVLPTPGFTDEEVVFFLGFVDASRVSTRAGVAAESEVIEPFVVSIDDALAALDQGQVANGLLVTALQWLALHRARLREYYERTGKTAT
jgi:ADP-ribose pyrophosphatase